MLLFSLDVQGVDVHIEDFVEGKGRGADGNDRRGREGADGIPWLPDFHFHPDFPNSARSPSLLP